MYTTAYRYNLKRHHGSKHPPAKKSACPYPGCGCTGACGFSRKDHLRSHCKKIHLRELPGSVANKSKNLPVPSKTIQTPSETIVTPNETLQTSTTSISKTAGGDSGRVERPYSERDFALITPDQGEDVFVLFRAITLPENQIGEEGQQVAFEVVQGQKCLQMDGERVEDSWCTSGKISNITAELSMNVSAANRESAASHEDVDRTFAEGIIPSPYADSPYSASDSHNGTWQLQLLILQSLSETTDAESRSSNGSQMLENTSVYAYPQGFCSYAEIPQVFRYLEKSCTRYTRERGLVRAHERRMHSEKPRISRFPPPRAKTFQCNHCGLYRMETKHHEHCVSCQRRYYSTSTFYDCKGKEIRRSEISSSSRYRYNMYDEG